MDLLRGASTAQSLFPRQYAAAKKTHPEIDQKALGGCGGRYVPFAHGAASIIEMEVGGKTVPLLSELMPEHIMGRFKMVQSEWHNLTDTDTAKAVEIKICQEGMLRHPVTCLDQCCPTGIMGKFPLEKFYAEGNEALTQLDWVRYFHDMSKGSDNPEMQGLFKVSEKFLQKHAVDNK